MCPGGEPGGAAGPLGLAARAPQPPPGLAGRAGTHEYPSGRVDLLPRLVERLRRDREGDLSARLAGERGRGGGSFVGSMDCGPDLYLTYVQVWGYPILMNLPVRSLELGPEDGSTVRRPARPSTRAPRRTTTARRRGRSPLLAEALEQIAATTTDAAARELVEEALALRSNGTIIGRSSQRRRSQRRLPWLRAQGTLVHGDHTRRSSRRPRERPSRRAGELRCGGSPRWRRLAVPADVRWRCIVPGHRAHPRSGSRVRSDLEYRADTAPVLARPRMRGRCHLDALLRRRHDGAGPSGDTQPSRFHPGADRGPVGSHHQERRHEGVTLG